jgi:RNA polymerase sigma-70 factor (ECF subfamily)
MAWMIEQSRTLLTAADSPSSSDERTRIEAAKTPRDFEEFFRERHADLFRALWLLCGNRQEAEEIMQDAFLRIWERWDRVAAMSDATGYLYRTGMNVFRSRARRARVALRRTVGASHRPDPLATVEQRDALVRQLLTLTPRQRAAIVLVDALDFTSEEAAIAMSIRPPTVRVLLARARASLRTMEVGDE